MREKKPDFICSITSNFWTDPDGRLHFFFDQSMGCAYGDPRGTTHMDGRAGVWESVCANPDDAKPVWSAPRRIGDGHALNKPIVAKDGTWYLPVCLNNGGGLWGKVFTELDARRGVNIYALTDRGRTWEYRGNCRVPMTDWHEPQLVELEDGRLWLLSRVWHCHNDRGIVQSFSKDGGRTWDETSYPGINNPIARFVCRKLRSGNILLVCHGRPEAWVGERTDLTAWLSRDDGNTWEKSYINTFGIGMPIHFTFYPIKKDHDFNLRLDFTPYFNCYREIAQEYSKEDETTQYSGIQTSEFPANIFNVNARFSVNWDVLGIFAETDLLPINNNIRVDETFADSYAYMNGHMFPYHVAFGFRFSL